MRYEVGNNEQKLFLQQGIGSERPVNEEKQNEVGNGLKIVARVGINIKSQESELRKSDFL